MDIIVLPCSKCAGKRRHHITLQEARGISLESLDPELMERIYTALLKKAWKIAQGALQGCEDRGRESAGGRKRH